MITARFGGVSIYITGAKMVLKVLDIADIAREGDFVGGILVGRS